MLHLFTPSKANEFDGTSELMTTTPIRNRLNQKKAYSKNNNLLTKPIVVEAVKQKTWEANGPKLTGGNSIPKK